MASASILGKLAAVEWRSLALRRAFCPACARQRWFARLASHETFIRCLGCRSSVVTLSLIAALHDRAASLLGGQVYELSARGALFRFLEKRAGQLTGSEFMDDVAGGESRDGVRSEDVQALSFADRSFDLVTSTEVFEHVPDDLAGFREVCRVLRPGGALMFTVPLSGHADTVQRASLKPGGEIEHILPPEYHTDPAQGGGAVLAWRNYGRDITDRLLEAGFAEATILAPDRRLPWDAGRPVVEAKV
jgi:SAM-dependent methyltransferase